MSNIFLDLTIVLVLAGVVAVLVNLLKQPSIIAYIITGLLLGSFGYHQLQQGNVFSALAEVGITLLLFMVGLELDISQLRKIGKTIAFVGLGQIVITALVAFGLLKLLGFQNLSAWYMAVALTFSSTIIVVKLISEKRDLQSLYGKITVGILLMQDIFAILLLISLASLSPQQPNIYGNLPAWQNILMIMVRGLALLLLIGWLSVKVFPKLLLKIGHNDEVLLVLSLAWALGLASFVSLPFMGFSLEIGGFLAGLSLARSAVHYQISAKIKPIRDFFIIIFFIVLGSQLVFSNPKEVILIAVALIVFVLIIKPLIVMLLLGLFGYKPRTSFFTGVALSQVSEFSLILMALGLQMGQLKKDELGLATLVGVATIAASGYFISHSHGIYLKLRGLAELFDFKKGAAEKDLRGVILKNHIILVGAHRMGKHLIETLRKQETPFVVVDFNPEIVEEYLEKGVTAICGDISDSYIQDQVNIEEAKLIISTIPDIDDNLILIEEVVRKTMGKKRRPKLIFTAQDEAETDYLYKKNIDYVISPHFVGGLHLAKILEGDRNLRGLKKLREDHLKILGY